MKRRVGIIAIILLVVGLGGGLLHLIIYGKRVRSFDQNFRSLQTSVAKAAKDMGSVDRFAVFTSTLESVALETRELGQLRKEYEYLTVAADALQRWWSKPSTGEKDLVALKSGIDETIAMTPSALERVFRAESRRIDQAFSESSSIAEVAGSVEELNSDLQALMPPLQVLRILRANGEATEQYPSLSNLDFRGIAGQEKALQSALDAGVLAIDRLRRSQSRSAQAAIEGAGSVRHAAAAVDEHVKWLREARSSLSAVCRSGASSSLCKREDESLKAALAAAGADLQVIGRVVDAQKRSSELMKVALGTMDTANASLRRMERFASSGQILDVHEEWRQAESEVSRAREALEVHASRGHQLRLAEGLLSRPRTKVDEIRRTVGRHRGVVYAKYQEALRQESTALGTAGRTAARTFDRLSRWGRKKVRQAANSRIGREIKLSGKALILGTKAFYDLMDPKADPLTWAVSYDDDIDQLMRESEQVSRMEGPSLTGKNTIIEALVNDSYESAFH